MREAIERVVHENKLLAIIIRSDYRKDGIEFFTPNDFSQQLAYMNRPTGYKIQPHIHNKVHREVFYTQEVLRHQKTEDVKVLKFDNFLVSHIVYACN